MTSPATDDDLDDLETDALSQPHIVAAIMLALEGMGVASINARQMNACIEAATIVYNALRTPHKPAVPGMGWRAWRGCDETGMSSEYMLSVLAPLVDTNAYCGVAPERVGDYPHDPSDLQRCVGLLEAAPELRPHLGVLAVGHGPVWSALIGAWAELEALLAAERGTGKSPRTYARMREVIEGAEKGGTPERSEP